MKILKALLLGTISALLVLIAGWLVGCTNHKVTLKGGAVILWQRVFTKASAEKFDFYYQDPNHVVWVIVNGPNTSVHPGRLTLKEPHSGVELGFVSE